MILKLSYINRFIAPIRVSSVQEDDLGVKTPPLTEICFNLLGFFEKKIPKHFQNFAIHIKEIKSTPSKTKI